jgi:hypothetical protein
MKWKCKNGKSKNGRWKPRKMFMSSRSWSICGSANETCQKLMVRVLGYQNIGCGNSFIWLSSWNKVLVEDFLFWLLY